MNQHKQTSRLTVHELFAERSFRLQPYKQVYQPHTWELGGYEVTGAR